jgi:hypothetical protein
LVIMGLDFLSAFSRFYYRRHNAQIVPPREPRVHRGMPASIFRRDFRWFYPPTCTGYILYFLYDRISMISTVFYHYAGPPGEREGQEAGSGKREAGSGKREAGSGKSAGECFPRTPAEPAPDLIRGFRLRAHSARSRALGDEAAPHRCPGFTRRRGCWDQAQGCAYS